MKNIQSIALASPEESSVTIYETPSNNFQFLKLIKNYHESKFENGKITREYYNRLLMIEYGSFAMSLIGLGLTIIQYELEFDEIEPEWSYKLLWIVFVSSILLGGLAIIREIFILNYDKTKNIISQEETLITTGRWKRLIIEVIICLIGPSPFLIGQRVYFSSMYNSHRIYLHINEILVFLVFGRILFIIRAIFLNTKYMTNRTQRICTMHDFQISQLFVIKCYMKEYPFQFISATIVILLPWMAYLLKICESPMTRIPTIPLNDDTFLNCLWNIIVTITTVGYGDYFPRTILGRCIIVGACIWGLVTISFIVISLSNILEMDAAEVKAFKKLKRLEYLDQIKKEAAYIITIVIKNWLLSRRINKERKRGHKEGHTNQKQCQKQKQKIKKETINQKYNFGGLARHLREFRIAKKQYENERENIEQFGDFELYINAINSTLHNADDIIEKLIKIKKASYISSNDHETLITSDKRQKNPHDNVYGDDGIIYSGNGGLGFMGATHGDEDLYEYESLAEENACIMPK